MSRLYGYTLRYRTHLILADLVAIGIVLGLMIAH